MSTLPEFRLAELPLNQILTLEHTYPVTLEQLFAAFTDQEQVAQWFRGTTWSVPTQTLEVNTVTGGSWKFTMVSNENPELYIPCTVTFASVTDDPQIDAVGELPGEDGPIPFYLRLEFIEGADGTTMRAFQGPFDPELYDTIEVRSEPIWAHLEEFLLKRYPSLTEAEAA